MRAGVDRSLSYGAKRQRHLFFTPLPENGNDDFITGSKLLHNIQKFVWRTGRLTVDGKNIICVIAVYKFSLIDNGATLLLLADNSKTTEASSIGWSARVNLCNFESLLGRQERHDAVIGSDNASVLDQLRHNSPDTIGGNRKANPCVLTGFSGDGDIHADDFGVGI